MISDEELELILAICDGFTDEDALAKKLNATPQKISAMIQVLISATPGCVTGLVMANMQRLGGSTVEHARNIRLTPVGQKVCETKSKIVTC
ncbi:MAG: hypothetical protein M1499_08820 [Firmicutes bacterium]|jgi:hypothetical protein|nr:hypothetical protein [Bacillota bacterium]